MNEEAKKRAEEIMTMAIAAAGKMTAYPEELSDEGLAELLIFCANAGLLTESDKDVVLITLSGLINFLSIDSGLKQTKEEIQEHVLGRSKYFTVLLMNIVKEANSFDPKPLYCALFRSPMTDVKYAAVEPKESELFKKIVKDIIFAMNKGE